MKRDICCYFHKKLPEVYNAYMQAIAMVLNKQGSPQPLHTITFGLNFSMKYNMNGGACTIHLIPYQNGTAVDVRYSLAQAAGARYEAHCKVLTQGVERLLGLNAVRVTLPIEMFLDPANQVTSANDLRCQGAQPGEAIPAAPVAPVAPVTAAPVQPIQPAPAVPGAKPFKFCMFCGEKLPTEARFCSRCGKPQP